MKLYIFFNLLQVLSRIIIALCLCWFIFLSLFINQFLYMFFEGYYVWKVWFIYFSIYILNFQTVSQDTQKNIYNTIQVCWILLDKNAFYCNPPFNPIQLMSMIWIIINENWCKMMSKFLKITIILFFWKISGVPSVTSHVNGCIRISSLWSLPITPQYHPMSLINTGKHDQFESILFQIISLH